MSSLIADYEYDIFISYRQNDNRSGWVTEFVRSLQEELASTIKQPVTVYFDSDPHEGLLETHNVDKSLERKLKCLIFVPILSQTYCDPESFAWQHEFVAFNRAAMNDRFGMDIKLGNNNVTSRILPVRIHDLDAEDKKMLEKELGNVLRPVDFIYREAGVNRPLKSDDNADSNLNKTKYRNQINKVANAIKDIISGLRQSNKEEGKRESNSIRDEKKPFQKRPVFLALLGLVLLAGTFLAYIFLKKDYEGATTIEKSIAVLPFVNMSNDPEQEYFSDGLSEEIINVLVHIDGLKVIGRTSSFQFKGKNEDLRKIGDLLNVATVLEGSVRQSINKVRITAQLIKTSDGTHLWSKTFDRDKADVFKVQEEIALAIGDEFKLTMNEIRPTTVYHERNEEAYRLFQIGRSIYDRAGVENSEIARKYFEQSVQLDTTFAPAWSNLSTCWINRDSLRLSYRFAQKALALDPLDMDALINQIYFEAFEGKLEEVNKRLQYILPLKVQHPRKLRTEGRLLCWFGHYEEGIKYGKRSLELDPLQGYAYSLLSEAFESNGQFREAEAMTRKGLGIVKQSGRLIKELIFNKKLDEALELIKEQKSENQRDFWFAVAYYAKNQKNEANAYLQKCKINFKESPYVLAQLSAFRNEYDEAFRYLELGFPKDHFLSFKSIFVGFGGYGYVYLKADPFFIPLRGDARFKKLTKRLNFPE